MIERTRYTFDMEPETSSWWEDLGEEGAWVRVHGGDLAVPLLIRLAQTSDGTPVVDGLLLGSGWPRTPVTADMLRTIRPAEILRQLFEGFGIDQGPASESLTDAIEWGLMQQFYFTLGYAPGRAPAINRAADSSELEKFATVYAAQRVKNRSRAMTTTAEQLNISRSTANRRLAKCREAGLL